MNTSSILAALGIRKRVLLRDLGREDSPVLRVSSPEAPSVSMAQERYQIVGEIARGGIGVVLKGRDIDLGRDVAMKVLRPEHARNTDLVERFVEEAQIEGQLQHPGIVPVYELGLRDKRPYFTMKLVKGQTLAALLAARADPAEDRRRFLGVFARVCETMAYAHARGVLHRDLKPSNVMVGAFGEVLVVDWGFAKVMQQEERQRDLSVVRTRRAQSGSGSLAGSVVGTPAYMAPEQALGEAAKIDARADVFALGAILCEILTGAPPYGGQGSDPLLQATRAELQDALARLDACGAEAELVATAKACLAPARAERPADAGAVAKRVGDHLAAVEERARRAQVEAAEATVRARGDRKARRLTLGLASAVAIALVAGGVGWWRLESDRRDRADSRATRVRAALADAAQRRGEAQGIGLAGWEGASGAAKAAVELARAPETPAALRDEAEQFAAQVEEDAAAARTEAEQERIETETLARLAEIRSSGGDTFNRYHSDDEYAGAFKECVGDINAMTPEAVASRVAASRIRTELCAALDDWASLGTEGAPHLLAILAAADPDPWRAEVRAAARAHDAERLGALAGEADAAAQPAHSLTLLAAALTAEADFEGAIALLRRSVPHHPDDVWVQFQLALYLSHETVRGFAEATGHYRAALALRPKSNEVRHFFGIALAETGRYDEALEVWRDALAADPSFVHLHEHLLETEQRQGALGSRIAELDEAIRARPTDASLHLQRGFALRLTWDWKRAAEAFQRSVELDPASGVGARLYCAIALANSGRLEEARQARWAVEGQFVQLPRGQQTSSLWEMVGTLRQRLGDLKAAAEAYRAAIDIMPDRGNSWDKLAAVLALNGDFDEAIGAYRQSLRHGGPSGALHTIADALHKAGRREDSVELCREAAPLLRKEIERAPGNRHRPYYALGAVLCDFLHDYDGAVEVFREGVEANAQDLNSRVSIGAALAKKADAEAAAAAYEEFLAFMPSGPRAHFSLGIQLCNLGKPEEALPHFERAQELGYQDPEYFDLNRGWLLVSLGRTEEGLQCLGRCAERRGVDRDRWESLSTTIARAAPKLPAMLRNEPVAANEQELIVLAKMQEWRGRFAAAADLHRRAFELDPSLPLEPNPLSPGWRWAASAAADAVFAGTGRGTDAPIEGADLRKEALAWLRIELDDWRGQLDRDPGTREAVRDALWWWKLDASFSPVRYAPHLALLPEAEQALWQAFWRDVDEVLERTRP